MRLTRELLYVGVKVEGWATLGAMEKEKIGNENRWEKSIFADVNETVASKIMTLSFF